MKQTKDKNDEKGLCNVNIVETNVLLCILMYAEEITCY